jgi:hypothetical protein
MSIAGARDILMRITPQTPENLDRDLARLMPAVSVGHDRYCGDPLAAVSAKLHAPVSTVCFGIRITAATDDIIGLAARAAQMAVERDAGVIVLSHVERTGLERFGFQVERVCGATGDERAAMERELAAYWNIVVII